MMGSEKHVLPNTSDMLSNRIKNSMNEGTGLSKKTIYGPSNNPLAVVDMEIASELTGAQKGKKAKKAKKKF